MGRILGMALLPIPRDCGGHDERVMRLGHGVGTGVGTSGATDGATGETTGEATGHRFGMSHGMSQSSSFVYINPCKLRAESLA